MFPLWFVEHPFLMVAAVLLNRQYCTPLFVKKENAMGKGAERKEEIKAKTALPLNKKLSELFDELTLEEFLVLVEEQTSSHTRSLVDRISDNLDAIYMEQLAKAQDFVNGNTNINVHAVRELLRELLPEQYAPAIKKIRQGQSVKTIINIIGGNNQILPVAEKGEQYIHFG